MELEYQEYGDKTAPLIVFLHGGGVSSWMWDKQVHSLTDYHCVTIDLPEHGINKDIGLFSISYSAYKVNELIKQIAQGKKVTVIGFSLGAQVLVQMLSAKSNQIDKAMINSALAKPSHFAVKMISPLIRLSSPLIKNKLFSKLQAKALCIGDDYFETYYKETSQMRASTLIRVLKENMLFSIPDSFRKAKANILVTVGEKEKSIMKTSAEMIASRHRESVSLIISGVGHTAPLAVPNVFNQLIRSFMTQD